MSFNVSQILIISFDPRSVQNRIIGITFNESKKRNLVPAFFIVQLACLVFFKVALFSEFIQTAEHPVLIHVMSMDDIVFVRKISLVAAIQENSADKRKLPFDIGIDVLQIIGTFENGIRNIRSFDFQPPKDIGIQFFQLIKRNHLLFGFYPRTLVSRKIGIRPLIDLMRIINLVASAGKQQQETQRNDCVH